MKKLIALILFPFLVIPFGAKANDNFSVEIEALTLVMEQYKENTGSEIELDISNKKPSDKVLVSRFHSSFTFAPSSLSSV